MRLTLSQKCKALLGGIKHRRQIRNLLVRRYWQQKTAWNLEFQGVSAAFAADDFYSNLWFYGPQNVEAAYEPSLTKLTIDFARKSRFFADIGANLGYFSVVAAKANPELKIVAIELDEMLAPIIRKNLRLNQLSNVQIKSGAVGDGTTVVTYQPHAYSFLIAAVGEATDMPRVDLQTRSFKLDSFFGEHGAMPDLVKMDVDGAELVALESAERMLSNPDLTMFLEVQTISLPGFDETAKQAGHFLVSRGFKLYSISDSVPVKLEPLKDLDDLPPRPTTAMILVTRRPLSIFGY